MNAARNQSIDIETSDKRQQLSLIMKLTWPALGENILSTLVSLADSAMVATLGTFAISAVGLVTQPRFIVISAFTALGIGTTALVARAKGEGNAEHANKVLRQSILMAIVLVCTVSLLMYIFAEPLVRWLSSGGISEESIQAALEYLRIQIYGFPILGVTFIINGALRGVGNTKAAFYTNLVANIVNVILNYLLIGGNFGFPALGVTGASLATVIGQCVAFCMAMYWLFEGKQYIRLRWGDSFKPDFPLIGRIARIGIPALFEQAAMRIGMMLFITIITSLGDNPYAAHTIGMNIQTLSFAVGNSFGVAVTTLTGQSLGRKRPDMARVYMSKTLWLCHAASLAVALFLFFGGGLAARLFTQDPEIIDLVAMVLKIIALVNIISNARFVYNSALRGAGDAAFTAKTTFLGILICRPVVAYVLVNFFNMGLAGVWIALSSDAVICFILAYIRWKNGKWAEIAV